MAIRKLLILSSLAIGTLLCGAALAAENAHLLVFERLTSDLVPEADGVLGELVERLKNDPGLGVTIEGYGQMPRERTYLYILGRNRMLRAFYALTSAGIDPSRIRLASKGQMPYTKELGMAPPERSLKLLLEERPGQVVAALTPASAATATGSDSVSLSYGPNDEDADPFPAAEVKALLQRVLVQPADRLLVRGHAAMRRGIESYPRAMARMRALLVLERLVLLGFPADRIDFEVDAELKPDHAPDSLASTKSQVSLIWVKKAAVTALANRQEPRAVAQPKLPEETVKPLESEAASWTMPPLRLMLDGGLALAGPELNEHVSSSWAYGLGIGGDLASYDAMLLRWALTYKRSSFKAREHDREGTIKFALTQLRTELVWPSQLASPYIAGAIGVTFWDGSISRPSSQRTNLGEGQDFSLVLGGGVELHLLDRLSLGPDILYNRIFGEFGGSIWTGTLRLQWRL